MVARVIEVIGGRPLGEFLRERLFEPLQMRDTAFEVPPKKRNRLSAMYGRPDITNQTLREVFEGWRNGVNERLDLSATYPVDAPHVFVRGGHGLFGTIARLFSLRPDVGQRRRTSTARGYSDARPSS